MQLDAFQSRKLATFLYSLAGGCADEAFYLGGDESYAVRGGGIEVSIDIDATFCRECGESVTRMLEARGFPKESESDWVPLCHDGAVTDDRQHCAWCCRLLVYALTDEGAAEAAAHYVDHPPTWPIENEHAYHLAAIYDTGHGTNAALNSRVARCLADGGQSLQQLVALDEDTECTDGTRRSL